MGIDRDDLWTQKAAIAVGALGGLAIILIGMFWLVPDSFPWFVSCLIFIIVGPLGAGLFFGLVYVLMWPLMKVEEYLRQ